MIRTIGLTIALLLLAGLAMAEPPTVELKRQVYVKGPNVTLGDIAEIAGDGAPYLKAIKVATAAMPGATRRLNAAIVRLRIEHAGLDPKNIIFRGPSLVHATTLSLDVSAEVLAASLRNFIEAEMPWAPDQATVDVLPPAQGLVVSDGEIDIRWRPNPVYNYLGAGSFRGEILVDGRVERRFYARAHIEAYDDVVVASRGLSRGERITASNVRLEKRALSRLTQGVYFSPEDLRGFVARTSIRQGQLVTERKVSPPELVKRNQLVIVETSIGTLTVQAQAKALNAAVVGDIVLCESTGTGQEYSGMLRSDGVVVVN